LGNAARAGRVILLSSSFLLTFFVLGFAVSFLPGQSIQLHVDLRDAPRNIYHAHLKVPAKPGEMALVFPKWIPGNHRPSGPIAALTGIRMEAGGQPLRWERDAIDMYLFRVTVPAGVAEIDVFLDAITAQDSAGGGGPAASSNVLDLNWNAVVLYPKDALSDDVKFVASVTLPAGWNFGTALPIAKRSAGEVDFSSVSLTTLIDSPLIAGLHYRQVELTKRGEAPAHVMDLVAESEPDLAMNAKDLGAYQKLVAEAGALFGARHYREYHFLLTLSDQVGGHGLEHHESNDSVAAERTLLDPNLGMLYGGLVPHEFTHSWNGKYRRPAGLATPNYQEPMVGDLLWVYEGLTEYLGNILAERSGFWTPEQYREALAETAAAQEKHTGRRWRSLEDTARSVQILRMAGPQWQSWRRGLDYYPEGELIWLEVDATIRQQTHGQRSMNDFCRRFHGGQSGPPQVVPYTFDDVVRTLNEIAPYDWARLLRERVAATAEHAPLGGIERGGWKLVYNDKPNVFAEAGEKYSMAADYSYSLGFSVTKDGSLTDVSVGSPAYRAGLGPGMKLLGVNGRKWTPDLMVAALKAAERSGPPIELLVENSQFFKTYSIDYHEGPKNPHLERIADQADLLGDILKPLTKTP
jgi:predicted metalloprotease with PDZ domain